MLIGSCTSSVSARAASHSESAQLYSDVKTTDAVSGGTSVASAIGSALSRHTPSRPQTEYLYRAPSPAPGTNSSHTPDPPSERIGCARPSQKLKSPTTLTPRALGAHTANDTPPSRTCAPRTRQSSSCLPSAIRCRSSSPSVGRYRYGSSWSSSGPSG